MYHRGTVHLRIKTAELCVTRKDESCRPFSPLGQLDRYAFPRPNGPLARSTSLSRSVLFNPLHRPITVLLAFLVIFSRLRYLARSVCQSSLRSHFMSKPSHLPLNNIQHHVILANVIGNSYRCIVYILQLGCPTVAQTSVVSARLMIEWSQVRIPLRRLGHFGNFLYPTLPVSCRRDTNSRWCLCHGK